MKWTWEQTPFKQEVRPTQTRPPNGQLSSLNLGEVRSLKTGCVFCHFTFHPPVAARKHSPVPPPAPAPHFPAQHQLTAETVNTGSLLSVSVNTFCFHYVLFTTLYMVTPESS